MNVVHLKFNLRYYRVVRAAVTQISSAQNYIYYKSGALGHFRVELPPNSSFSLPNGIIQITKKDSTVTNQKMMDRFKSKIQLISMNTHRMDIADVEDLFLYDIFHLFGFDSNGLFLALSDSTVYFVHKQILNYKYAKKIIENFASQNQMRCVSTQVDVWQCTEYSVNL